MAPDGSVGMRVEIRGLCKAFGTFRALDDVSLDIVAGQFCALLGPSGSGKTTLLRILAGLDYPDQGQVRFSGEDVLDRDARDRRVGFVFQHYALFRHMTVFENVAFGLRVRPRATRPAKAEIRQRVERLLTLVQLQGLAGRYPTQLSGGQRQRVALARSLAIEPRILLLDEPFGALDAQVRKELRRWLRELHDRLGLTTVFVTHDQEEALDLADQVVVLSQGRIEQIGRPQEVYDRPATPFVYGFLGNANRLKAQIDNGRVIFEGADLGAAGDDPPASGEAIVFIRPHEFEVLPGSAEAGIPARLRSVNLSGPLLRLDLQSRNAGADLEVELPRDRTDHVSLVPGELLRLVPRRFGLFPPE